MRNRNLSTAAEAVKRAAIVLRHPERTNSDIVSLRSEEQEGYGIYELALSVKEKLFGVKGKYNKALTVMTIANRVYPAEARTMFLWLYGDKDGHKLRDLAASLYHRLQWPTDSGTVDPRVGVNICVSMLLRHYWFRNGVDYDRQYRPMSPTVMSKLLGLSVHPKKGPLVFHSFQAKRAFPVLELWELSADNQISQELANKDIV